MLEEVDLYHVQDTEAERHKLCCHDSRVDRVVEDKAGSEKQAERHRSSTMWKHFWGIPIISSEQVTISLSSS